MVEFLWISHEKRHPLSPEVAPRSRPVAPVAPAVSEVHSTSGRPCQRGGSSATWACQSTSPTAQLPEVSNELSAGSKASRPKHGEMATFLEDLPSGEVT